MIQFRISTVQHEITQFLRLALKAVLEQPSQKSPSACVDVHTLTLLKALPSHWHKVTESEGGSWEGQLLKEGECEGEKEQHRKTAAADLVAGSLS